MYDPLDEDEPLWNGTESAFNKVFPKFEEVEYGPVYGDYSVSNPTQSSDEDDNDSIPTNCLHDLRPVTLVITTEPDEEVNMYDMYNYEEEQEDSKMPALEENTNRGESSGLEAWLFDTGATVHVTNSDTHLYNLVYAKQTIRVADNTIVHSEKSGDLTLEDEREQNSFYVTYSMYRRLREI